MVSLPLAMAVGVLEILLKWLFLCIISSKFSFCILSFSETRRRDHCLCRHTCSERAVAPNAPLELRLYKPWSSLLFFCVYGKKMWHGKDHDTGSGRALLFAWLAMRVSCVRDTWIEPKVKCVKLQGENAYTATPPDRRAWLAFPFVAFLFSFLFESHGVFSVVF